MRRPILPRCHACGSGNVVGRVMAIKSNRSSHWYECKNCKYSSPGRDTWAQADYDVDWQDIDNGKFCTPLGEYLPEVTP